MDLLRALAVGSYFLIADTLWISLFATAQYQSRLGELLKMAEGLPLMLGLLAVYALLLIGLFLFVLTPDASYTKAVTFGFVVYGVYGLTNYLIMPVWSIDLVIVDFFWGGFLYGSSLLVAKWINYIQ